MALVPAISTVDDGRYFSNFGLTQWGGAVQPSAYSGALVPRTTNPFHKNEAPYYGPVGVPNVHRPLLRPENDRLDKLVQIALAKMEVGIDTLKALSGECDAFRQEMAGSDTGGSGQLREQLRMANKEIYRLRTLLTMEGGAGDLLDHGLAAQQMVRETVDTGLTESPTSAQDIAMQMQQQMSQQQQLQQLQHQQEGSPHFSFFGLMVADSVRFKEYGGKHEYGAVKVVKVWGPSAVAGIMPMDFITHINKQKVANLQDFNTVVGTIAPNNAVEIMVERNNREMTFIVHTSDTDIAPGTITHQNIVHAHLTQGDEERFIEGAPSGTAAAGGATADENPTLHL